MLVQGVRVLHRRKKSLANLHTTTQYFIAAQEYQKSEQASVIPTTEENYSSTGHRKPYRDDMFSRVCEAKGQPRFLAGYIEGTSVEVYPGPHIFDVGRELLRANPLRRKHSRSKRQRKERTDPVKSAAQ